MAEARAERIEERETTAGKPGDRFSAWTSVLAEQPIVRAGLLYAGMKRALELLAQLPDTPHERVPQLRMLVGRGEYVPPMPQLAERLLPPVGVLPEHGSGSLTEASEAEAA